MPPSLEKTDDISIAIGEENFNELFDFSPQKMEVVVDKISVWTEDDSKQILKNISTHFQPGKFTGILGPSGSGKTTLLNTLTGQTKGKQEGRILINGQKQTKQFKRKIGYVMQQDLMFSQLTVEETLLVTAWLRLPQSWADSEKRKRVERIISLLGLDKTAKTKVGKPFGPSISGGEKKRLNVANEALTNPSVMFLDEPTSGLDSTSAKGLVELLRELAHGGRTIVTSIHQPSSSIFYHFDQIIVLAEGRIIYDGPPEGLLPYFAQFGIQCSKSYNPADFALDICSDVETLKKLPTVSYEFDAKKGKAEEVSKSLTEPEQKWPTDWLTQFKILLWRAFIQKRGDIITGLEFFRWGGVALIACLCWFQIPRKEDHIHDYVGFVFFICVFSTFVVSYSSLFQFLGESSVITRERRTGAYRLSAYYVAKIVAEWPIEILYPSVFFTVCFWSAGLNTNFFIFIQCYFIYIFHIFCASSLGCALGVYHLDVKKSQIAVSVTVLSMMLLGGFYVNDRNLPDFISWAAYLSMIRHPYLLIVATCVQDVEFDCSEESAYEVCLTQSTIAGEEVLKHQGFADQAGVSVALMLSAMLGLRICAYYLLNKNMK